MADLSDSSSGLRGRGSLGLGQTYCGCVIWCRLGARKPSPPLAFECCLRGLGRGRFERLARTATFLPFPAGIIVGT